MKLGIGIGLTTRRGPSGAAPSFDPDAAAYISAVETADGAALEEGVKTAINDFVVGCKSDAIWDAIKASCILAGARTLSGALVPLVGTAPTNVNFVSADYNRKTGLKGDGATKYLDSNRAGNAQGQNNVHMAVYANDVASSGMFWSTGAAGTSGRNVGFVGDTDGTTNTFITSVNQAALPLGLVNRPVLTSPSFLGTSRSGSGNYVLRSNQSSVTVTQASEAPAANDFHIFAHPNGSLPGEHRLSFYSIGEALDLAALDTRVSALMTALDGAIA
jgi:hypothetical protein